MTAAMSYVYFAEAATKLGQTLVAHAPLACVHSVVQSGSVWWRHNAQAARAIHVVADVAVLAICLPQYFI